MTTSINVLNEPLNICSLNPVTGFSRNGYCDTGENDIGNHTICATMTNEFLNYSKATGNDLLTPTKNFPGLKQGNRWCVCSNRWKSAYNKGVAPPVHLKATNIKALVNLDMNSLEEFNTPVHHLSKNHISSLTSKQVLTTFLNLGINGNLAQALDYTILTDSSSYKLFIEIFNNVQNAKFYISNIYQLDLFIIQYSVILTSKSKPDIKLLITLKRQGGPNNTIKISYNLMYWKINNIQLL